MAERRRTLAPEAEGVFHALSKAVFAEGALDARAKQISPVAVAHVTQCPWCIEGHMKAVRRSDATPKEIMEAIWVAAEMRAGAAFTDVVPAGERLRRMADEADALLARLRSDGCGRKEARHGGE